MSTWETEEDSKRPLDYQVKASLILEDSNKETWGLVKFLGNTIFPKPGEGELVGTWSKAAIDGYYYVFLETPIMALVDKATQLHAELVRKRNEGLIQPSRKVSRGPKVEAEAPDVSLFASLRKRLKEG